MTDERSPAAVDPAEREARFDAVMAKLRKLLAKAERTDVPAEAAAFTAKAQQLMAAWSIDEAMLAEGGDGDARRPVVARTIGLASPHAVRRAVLAQAVTQANGCEGVRTRSATAPSGWDWVVVGQEHDADWVETLLASLDAQLDHELRAARRHRPKGEAGTTFAVAFVTAFCATVAQRVLAAAAEAERAAKAAEAPAGAPGGGGSVALVLAAKADEVHEGFRARFPHVRTVRLAATTSAAGRRAGADAGRRASIARGAAGRARRGELAG